MKERVPLKLNCIILLAIFLWPVHSFCQVRDSTALDSIKRSKAGSEKAANANILVVSFQPQMYVVSGDQFICQQSRMTPGELSDMIRRSLATTLMYNMSDLFNVVDMPNKLEDKNSDLSVMYQITRYKNSYKKLKSYFKNYPPIKLINAIGPSYMRWGTDCVNNTAQKPIIAHHKYVRAEIIKDSIYAGICKRYNAHFTLFITEFEMSTRFKNCLDLQNQVFQRDFFIHYTLLDAEGRFVDGGVVGTTFQSATNDINKILDKNLGTLTGLIIEEIRKKI